MTSHFKNYCLAWITKAILDKLVWPPRETHKRMTNKWGSSHSVVCTYVCGARTYDPRTNLTECTCKLRWQHSYGITYLAMLFLCQSSIVTNYSHYDNSKIKNNKKWVHLSPDGAPRSLASKHWLPYARTGGGKRGQTIYIYYYYAMGQ
jgi:hypothetical protein